MPVSRPPATLPAWRSLAVPWLPGRFEDPSEEFVDAGPGMPGGDCSTPRRQFPDGNRNEGPLTVLSHRCRPTVERIVALPNVKGPVIPRGGFRSRSSSGSGDAGTRVISSPIPLSALERRD